MEKRGNRWLYFGRGRATQGEGRGSVSSTAAQPPPSGWTRSFDQNAAQPGSTGTSRGRGRGAPIIHQDWHGRQELIQMKRQGQNVQVDQFIDFFGNTAGKGSGANNQLPQTSMTASQIARPQSSAGKGQSILRYGSKPLNRQRMASQTVSPKASPQTSSGGGGGILGADSGPHNQQPKASPTASRTASPQTGIGRASKFLGRGSRLHNQEPIGLQSASKAVPRQPSLGRGHRILGRGSGPHNQPPMISSMASRSVSPRQGLGRGRRLQQFGREMRQLTEGFDQDFNRLPQMVADVCCGCGESNDKEDMVMPCANCPFIEFHYHCLCLWIKITNDQPCPSCNGGWLLKTRLEDHRISRHKRLNFCEKVIAVGSTAEFWLVFAAIQVMAWMRSDFNSDFVTEKKIVGGKKSTVMVKSRYYGTNILALISVYGLLFWLIGRMLKMGHRGRDMIVMRDFDGHKEVPGVQHVFYLNDNEKEE